MKYTPLLQMLADMFTMPVPKELFRVMRTKVLGCSVIYCTKDVEIWDAKTIRVRVLHCQVLRGIVGYCNCLSIMG